MTMPDGAGPPAIRLQALRRYFAVMLPGNLAWEIAHLPLYTLWTTGTLREQAFAVAHCTAGDLLIAAVSLMCALLLMGDARWPRTGFPRVASLAVAIGAGYTVFSEWLNTVVRGSWAYADTMPLIPFLGTGLTPLLQWIVVPPVAFWYARRATRL
jgi:hypothetical protein